METANRQNAANRGDGNFPPLPGYTFFSKHWRWLK